MGVQPRIEIDVVDVQLIDNARDLGSGPFRILYDWVLPYRSIRAVGRFGIPMMLFLSAGAGFGVAALERRLADRPRWRQLGALLLILGLVLEYRVSPLPTHDAVPADRTLYRALRDLPGDGGVLHLPMHPNDIESESTEYMLGSTLHWRPLANGLPGRWPMHGSLPREWQMIQDGSARQALSPFG